MRLHQETCIQAKLFNDVFGQESHSTVQRRPCWRFGFWAPAPDGNMVSSVSLRPLHWTTVRCTQAKRCAGPSPPGGICTIFLKVSICASDLSPLQRKLIRLECPHFPGATRVINTRLKIAVSTKIIQVCFFFKPHQNNLLCCAGST